MPRRFAALCACGSRLELSFKSAVGFGGRVRGRCPRQFSLPGKSLVALINWRRSTEAAASQARMGDPCGRSLWAFHAGAIYAGDQVAMMSSTMIVIDDPR